MIGMDLPWRRLSAGTRLRKYAKMPCFSSLWQCGPHIPSVRERKKLEVVNLDYYLISVAGHVIEEERDPATGIEFCLSSRQNWKGCMLENHITWHMTLYYLGKPTSCYSLPIRTCTCTVSNITCSLVEVVVMLLSLYTLQPYLAECLKSSSFNLNIVLQLTCFLIMCIGTLQFGPLKAKNAIYKSILYFILRYL